MDAVVQQVLNAVALGGTYALLALGLALIFGVLRMINFAHGDLMTIAGYASVFLLGAAVPFGLAVTAAVIVAAAAAILMERTAFRPVRETPLATTLLTSYAVSAILHVLFQNLVSPRPVALAVPDGLLGRLAVGPLGVGVIQAISIGATAVLLGLLVLFLTRSRFGIAMRAAAQDFPTARLMGIDANRVIATAFAISGLLAGVAGILWIAQRGAVDPLMGFTPVLKAFIATVIGGLGSLGGAVVGGFVLAAVEVLLRAALPDGALAFREALSLSVVIAILLWRPEGLFGRDVAAR